MPTNIPHDVSDVGQGKSHSDVTEKYDSAAGKYQDKITPIATEERLPTTQMPKGADPSPFVLGPMSSGGRE